MLISDDGRRFAFTKPELRLLTSVMAGPERETFAALWVHPSKGHAWATDGHRAVLASHGRAPSKTTQGNRPVAIPAATAHHVAKTAGPRDFVVLDIGGDAAELNTRSPLVAKGEPPSTFADVVAATTSTHVVTCAKKPHSGAIAIEEFFPAASTRGARGAVTALDSALLKPVQLLGRVGPNGTIWINLATSEVEPVLFVAEGEHSTMWQLIVMPMRPRSRPGILAAAKPSKAGPGTPETRAAS